MTILVGTSSWSDPGFVEHWYPKGLPANERLSFYAERFDAVELNSSFYAIPATSTVRRTISSCRAGSSRTRPRSLVSTSSRSSLGSSFSCEA